MAVNALVNVATGSVISWGACEFVAGPGEIVIPILDEGFSYPNAENRTPYVKVVDGLFEAMTPAEREAVDAAIPQRRVQRMMHISDVLVSTNQSDIDGGWGDVIALTLAEPLLAGAYQVVCGFEIALGATTSVHTAQARLEIDGLEVATWCNSRHAFNRCQYVDTFAFARGARPTFRLRIRRFGPGIGTARARKASLVLYPAQPIRAELL